MAFEPGPGAPQQPMASPPQSAPDPAAGGSMTDAAQAAANQVSGPPSVSAGAGGPPGQGAGIGAGPAGAPPSPQVKAAAADNQHHNMIGRAARFLMGAQMDYQVDDKGNVQQVPIQQKPGQMFRSILAGAILGGAMGAEGSRNSRGPAFAGGFARGAAGVQNEQAQADQNRYQRAVQQFNMRQQAARETSETDLRKSQIALHNASVFTQHVMLNKSVMAQDIQSVKDGQDMMQPFVHAGVQTQYADTPASQMDELFKTNPQAHDLMWLPTGYSVKQNDKGEQYAEIRYSAVDPKGKVKLTPGVLKQFDKVELDKFYNGAKDLKAGQEMDAQHYMALMGAYNDRYNTQMAQTQQDLKNGLDTANTKHLYAEAAHLYAEAANERLAKKDLDRFQTASAHFAEVGYDRAKLDAKYPGDSAVMAKGAADMMGKVSTALNAALKEDPDGSSDLVKNLVEQQGVLGDMVKYAFQPPPAQGPAPSVTGGPTNKVQNIVKDVTGQGGIDDETGDVAPTKQLSPQDSYSKIDSSNLSGQEKLDAWKQSGSEVPWSAIEAAAKQRNMSPADIVKHFKDSGIKVEAGPRQKAQELERNIPPPSPIGMM